MISFYIVIALAVGSGLITFLKGKGGYFVSGLSALAFAVSLVSVLSFIAPYVYELPTHHCPFCILQKEYGYVGYPLYITLFGGTILGLGVGALAPFRRIKSLSPILPAVQRRLALISSLLFLIFGGLVTGLILLSNLVLE